MYFDYTYILVLAGALICAIASANVTRTFNKYSKVRNMRGITAEQCADMILRYSDVTDVKIERINGSLTDHYSPKEKVLRLSDSVYSSSSLAALGVAAHECGHAIQHKEGYLPLKLRSLSVPLANIGSYISWPLIIIGLIFGIMNIAKIGVYLFAFVVLFQLITLPVEFNASRRAIAILQDNGILAFEEVGSASKVLRAAALTYVAALISSILQMLRLILLTRGNRRR